VGADAASSHVVDTTVENGELTFIKQISPITPTSPDANFVEP
jgi:hypothetical protein